VRSARIADGLEIDMQNGVLLIDKPEGPSSAHIVRRVKDISGAKKVGHLGSLDPFASGLLLLGINEGTKIADVFLAASKDYRGVMTLGTRTDSQDSTGRVIETRSVPALGSVELSALEAKFTGDLQQIPPMFSALKKDGVRLYKLARQGKEVPRAPRSIRIERLQLCQLNNAEIEFEVTCSRGTYIRTLAADMGEFLGCGGHLKSLRRTACGHLTVERATTLEKLEGLREKEQMPMISLETALSHLRALTWESGMLSRLRLGQQEVLRQIGHRDNGEKLLCILDLRRNLVALVEWAEEPMGRGWRLLRVFRS
jgi:tRNA pseudouridine55 synthase